MPGSEFLDLNRDGGLTHVIDKGLGPRAWEDVLETSGEYIDIVKLGWGTAYVTPNLQRKLDVLKEKPVVIGGTFFEAVYAQGKLDEYKRWLGELGMTHVEISDGVVDLPRERKLELIADFARDFTVLSEVGSKDAEAVFAPYQWVEWIKGELEAGAWKVITEGREGGTAGIYRPTGEMRTGLVDEIVHEVDLDDLLFEAPTKASQAWFVKQFGPGVNLGNIPPEEVIPLETLRLGLRGRHAEGGAALATPSLQLPDVETMPAEDVLRWAYEEFGDRLCLTCSWQKQSSVLVHMVSELELDIPVVELDTHLFFRESYETRDRLVERYGITCSRRRT